MPLYDYQCSKCQHVVEVRHGFNDTYAEACSACGGEMKRVINPAPIIFKGSGFYVTDSRKSSPSESSSGASSSGASSPAASPPPPSKESAA
jgi:putative FmdB family regulatory protein